MTTLKTKQEFMLGMETTLLRLCAGERCINEAHVCARINRREATTYSHGEIRRGLERLLDKGLVQKLNVTGDVWRFLNEKIIEVKPQPIASKPILSKVENLALKYEPKRKNIWTTKIEGIVKELILAGFDLKDTTNYLFENYNFTIDTKRLARRISTMRKIGALPADARSKPKILWQEFEVQELVRLKNSGLTFPELAPILSENIKREITKGAATSKYREYLYNLEKNSCSCPINNIKQTSQNHDFAAKSAGLRGATNTPTSPNRLDKIGVTWLRT